MKNANASIQFVVERKSFPPCAEVLQLVNAFSHTRIGHKTCCSGHN